MIVLRAMVAVAAILTCLVPCATGRLFASEVGDDVLLEVDPSSGAVSVLGPISSPTIASLAYDEFSDTLYGTDSGTWELVTIDTTTGNTVVVGNIGIELPHASAIDLGDGTLYVVGLDSSQDCQSFLYTVNKSTALATLVGPIGFRNVGSLDFDPVTGTLYGATGGDAADGVLITIDSATGLGTFVADTIWTSAMSFDSDGQLYAVDSGPYPGNDSALYIIDVSDGTSSLIGSMEVDNVLGLVFGAGGTPVVSGTWSRIKARYMSAE